MAEVKYKYALDEKNNLVSINDINNDTQGKHTYTCLGCGNELLPRAINSKYRKAHFYHKELIACDGETYIHKLTKRVIKEKFDTQDKFIISFPVTKYCTQKNCRLAHYNCIQINQQYELDLKEIYDTCLEEQYIDGYIADLLITNSMDNNIPPILIEVCYSHPCETKKRQSGLKIIEVSVKNEADIESLFENGILREPKDEYPFHTTQKKKKVECISFNRVRNEQLHIPIMRYVFNPKRCINGYITQIDCCKADSKIRKESEVELNISPRDNMSEEEIITRLWNNNIPFHSTNYLYMSLLWMNKYKHLRRCDLCKFYYATSYENSAICRLSKKYGKPKFPEMSQAEQCRSFHTRDSNLGIDINNYNIEEIYKEPASYRPEYKVIIAGSSSFNDNKLFNDKCYFYLSKKMETHSIIILSGTSYHTKSMTQEFADIHQLQVEFYEAKWDRDGDNATILTQDKMLIDADALIVFWDGKSTYTKNLIDKAEKKDMRIARIYYDT